MIGFEALQLQKARERFKLGLPSVVQLSSGAVEAQCIVWTDEADAEPDGFANTLAGTQHRLNFLKEEVGELPKDTRVEIEDGRVYVVDGAPERERDHEVRYRARKLQ